MKKFKLFQRLLIGLTAFIPFLLGMFCNAILLGFSAGMEWADQLSEKR